MLDIETARRLLAYDPETGRFTWKVKRKGKPSATGEAGYRVGDGRVQIIIARKPYKAHRIAWLLYYGRWPLGCLDHINGDPADNRIANLREATMSQNSGNARLSKRNTSGAKGVSWCKRTQLWQAGIKTHGRCRHLGRFKTIEEAAAAYERAARDHWGEFARMR